MDFLPKAEITQTIADGETTPQSEVSSASQLIKNIPPSGKLAYIKFPT
jgi:hypothetical protein